MTPTNCCVLQRRWEWRSSSLDPPGRRVGGADRQPNAPRPGRHLLHVLGGTAMRRGEPVGAEVLPPTYRLKDQDREKYAAIGESDRFVLKFVKP